MKISTRIILSVAILFALALINAALIFWQLDGMNDDGRVVNFAGIVRGATQRLVKLENAGQPSDKLIAKLDKIINGLINGSTELQLPKADNKEFIADMARVNNEWSSLKDTIIRTRSDRSLQPELVRQSEAYFEMTDKAVAAAEKDAKGNVSAIKTMQIIFLLLNGCIFVLVLLGVFRYIVKPLAVLKARVLEISNGDLSVTVGAEGRKDEISALSQDMGNMVKSLAEIIVGLMTTTNKVVYALDAVRIKSSTTALGAKEQANQAQQIAAAAEQMSQTITDIARNASAASQSSAEAMDMADSGKDIMDIVLSKVNSLFSSTEELSSMVNGLNHSVSEIGDITTVIKDIADQTNLLALNAAIEAARAGEQGRGFAVVADEVRKLAERTIKATNQITGRISAVQQESERAAQSMSQTAGEVGQSKDFITKAGQSLNLIVEMVKKIQDEITRIATAVDEQSAASEEVSSNIEKSSSISMDMEKTAGQVMHEMNKLITAAEELRITTTGFKIGGHETLILDLAKTDHRLFMGKIAAGLSGDIKIDHSNLPDHHGCRFGKWYDSKGRQVCGMLPSYQKIDQPHEKIHSMAKEAVSAYNSGNSEKAEQIYEEMEAVSATIGGYLEDIKSEYGMRSS